MSTKLKIVTVNIGNDKTDVVALALRDMQSDLDAGWEIVGQSQYNNAISYTLKLTELTVPTKVDIGGPLASIDPNFGVSTLTQTNLGSGPALH